MPALSLSVMGGADAMSLVKAPQEAYLGLAEKGKVICEAQTCFKGTLGVVGSCIGTLLPFLFRGLGGVRVGQTAPSQGISSCNTFHLVSLHSLKRFL